MVAEQRNWPDSENEIWMLVTLKEFQVCLPSFVEMLRCQNLTVDPLR